MKTTRSSLLHAAIATEQDKHTGSGAGREQMTRQERVASQEAAKAPVSKDAPPEAPKAAQRSAVALMSAQALRIAVAARPELAAALKGHTVACRRLGDGDEKLPRLDQMAEIGPDTLVIGFNVPLNLVVRGRKGIEIPLGKAMSKTDAGSKIVPVTVENTPNPMAETLVKALAETSRIPLRGFVAQFAPVVEGDPEPENEADKAEQEIAFN